VLLILFFFVTQKQGGIVLCHAALRDDEHAIQITPVELLPVSRGEWMGRSKITWVSEKVCLFV
jgi:hypothetical protein